MTELCRQILRNAQTFLPADCTSGGWTLSSGGTGFCTVGTSGSSRRCRGDCRQVTHVLDLGANRGQSIESMLVLGVPGLRITAFEPQSSLADRLRRRYPSGVTMHNVGVGDEEGEMILITPSYRGYRFDGLASTDRELAVDWFRYAMKPFDRSC